MEFESFKPDFTNPNEFYNISMSFYNLRMKFYFTQLFVAITELALEVILRNNSAHSLVIGQVITDPFISPLGLNDSSIIQNPNSPIPRHFYNNF